MASRVARLNLLRTRDCEQVRRALKDLIGCNRVCERTGAVLTCSPRIRRCRRRKFDANVTSSSSAYLSLPACCAAHNWLAASKAILLSALADLPPLVSVCELDSDFCWQTTKVTFGRSQARQGPLSVCPLMPTRDDGRHVAVCVCAGETRNFNSQFFSRRAAPTLRAALFL